MDPITEQLKDTNPNPFGTTPIRSLMPNYLSGFQRGHVVKDVQIERIKPRKKNKTKLSLTLSVPIEISDCKNLKGRDSLRITLQDYEKNRLKPLIDYHKSEKEQS